MPQEGLIKLPSVYNFDALSFGEVEIHVLSAAQESIVEVISDPSFPETDQTVDEKVSKGPASYSKT